MIYNRYGQELTKSERLILDIISEIGEYDYSLTDTGYLLDISRQTVCRGFKKLVNLGFVTKEIFYEKKIKRCRYKVDSNISSVKTTSNISINDTSINTSNISTSTSTSNISINTSNISTSTSNNASAKSGNQQGRVKNLMYKKEPSPKRTKLSPNDINCNDLYNIDIIYKSNQSKDITESIVCQGKKIQAIDEFINSNASEGSITKALKTIAKKIFCEKNEQSQSVARFFEKESKEEQKDVLWSIVGSVTRRMLDKTKAKIKNLYGYIRIALINAVQAFYASKVEESEAKTLLYESVVQLHCPSATFNSPTVKSKIDCSSLAHNFEQREYSVEYLESFYKNLGNDVVKSSPAMSTPAKDVVMEQIRAMRDSFGYKGRIKPLTCVDLY